MSISFPNTFTANTLIKSAEVNANFTAISGHIAAAEGSANAVVITSASNNLTSEAQLAVSRGGTAVATANAATFFAGPTSGSAAAPSFRVLQAPVITKFTTAASGTFTSTTGVFFTRVRLVGGGGGGAGGGTAGGTAAGDGAASTFGTTLLSAGGGIKAVWPFAGGAGGTSSLGSGPTGTVLTGGYGVFSYGGGGATAVNISGSSGGSSALGGAGGGDTPGAGGAKAGIANTGGGGGGGNSGSSANCVGGPGGGAGGFVDAIITSPAASYAYVVGAGGTAGGAGSGTGATAGAAGGTGYIEITEYFQ